MLKVTMLIVTLTLLVDLQQAAEDPNIGFNQPPEEKSGNGPITININTITRDETGDSQLGKVFQDNLADTNQALVIFTLQEQVKDLQSNIKDLTIELCRTKQDCCNKTLTCPCGYEQFSEKPDMCYKFSTDKKENYAYARSDCRADGGHLVMPKDQATNDFLEKQMKMRNMFYVWIGLTEQVQKGTWAWDDGTTHVVGTDYGDWKKGYPQSEDYLNLNCAKWMSNGVYLQWVNGIRVCYARNAYICEAKASPSQVYVLWP